jgi:transcriptional regulator with XRE-family HTH domain
VPLALSHLLVHSARVRKREVTVNPVALRLIRNLIGISQPKLADASGVSTGMIGSIESGTKQPSKDTAEKIRAALETAAGTRAGPEGVKLAAFATLVVAGEVASFPEPEAA